MNKTGVSFLSRFVIMVVAAIGLAFPASSLAQGDGWLGVGAGSNPESEDRREPYRLKMRCKRVGERVSQCKTGGGQSGAGNIGHQHLSGNVQIRCGQYRGPRLPAPEFETHSPEGREA